jgi:hypothetical protein
MRSVVSPLLAALAVLSLPSPGRAQLMASEPASVSQTVDGTRITVEYSRPRARGRRGLFGTRIHAGEIWTPGANAATTLALSKDATIEGRPVPKGKYSVWIVTAPAQWELVLDPDTARWHTMGPTQRAGQVRLPIRRETRPFMEVLTWWFPEVGSTGTTLAMQWDTVYVPLRIGVPASYTRAVPPEAARRIVGRYRMLSEPMPGPPPGAGAEGGREEEGPARDVEFTVRYEGNELRAVMNPPLFRTESGYTDWILVPGKSGWYKLGRFDGGELVELVDFVAVQFDPEGEKAKGFEVRAGNDSVMARGTRLP